MVYFSKWKISIILGIVFLGFAIAAPNLLEQKTADKLPDWLPNQQVNLGLDLQGGSHLLLEGAITPKFAQVGCVSKSLPKIC